MDGGYRFIGIEKAGGEVVDLHNVKVHIEDYLYHRLTMQWHFCLYYSMEGSRVSANEQPVPLQANQSETGTHIQHT